MAGEVGIEPTYGSFKGSCLTAWLLPKLFMTLASAARALAEAELLHNHN